MDGILFIFVGIMCLYVAIRTFSAPERNTVFNKRPIDVVDVKKYNQFCGGLILGFGAAAELTIVAMMFTTGIWSSLCTVGIVVEALLVVYIYNKFELRFLKKR
ncbi:MAG: hypothetical protein NC420_02050 [Eubacterium sp.]|nr:hypothetical protein [Eubacterium sp.]MCM1303521.1 hypothetical protein [Butyrivibrio sp.]MCM1342715.1 hypothetical protein [Muribaculaceae bacterium]MCM1410021.1 hypothetical protein [Lachnospiraceae bacterium]